jgi:hypothetical protein
MLVAIGGYYSLRRSRRDKVVVCSHGMALVLRPPAIPLPSPTQLFATTVVDKRLQDERFLSEHAMMREEGGALSRGNRLAAA